MEGLRFHSPAGTRDLPTRQKVRSQKVCKRAAVSCLGPRVGCEMTTFAVRGASSIGVREGQTSKHSGAKRGGPGELVWAVWLENSARQMGSGKRDFFRLGCQRRRSHGGLERDIAKHRVGGMTTAVSAPAKVIQALHAAGSGHQST